MTIYKTTSWTLRSHPAHRFCLTETLTVDGRHHMLRLLLDDNLYLAPIIRKCASLTLRPACIRRRHGNRHLVWLRPNDPDVHPPTDKRQGNVRAMLSVTPQFTDALNLTPWHQRPRRRVPRRRSHRHRPLANPARIPAAKLQVRDRRLLLGLDIPARPLRPDPHPVSVRQRGRLAAPVQGSIQVSRVHVHAISQPLNR